MNGTVAAILLAAGKSRRMGRCKQLLPLGDTTVIGRCLDTLKCGGVNDIVVVVSPDASEVVRAAEQHAVMIAVNHEGNGDMASSIRCGREALAACYKGVLIALCDYPLVSPATVGLLAHMNTLFPDSIVTPLHSGRRGHPLLIARSILNELEPGFTLRDLLDREPARVYELPVDDPGVLLDMDTPDDYVRIIAHQDSTGMPVSA
jgi:molybdenum cofactor cytidylyltransferase